MSKNMTNNKSLGWGTDFEVNHGRARFRPAGQAQGSLATFPFKLVLEKWHDMSARGRYLPRAAEVAV